MAPVYGSMTTARNARRAVSNVSGRKLFSSRNWRLAVDRQLDAAARLRQRRVVARIGGRVAGAGKDGLARLLDAVAALPVLGNEAQQLACQRRVGKPTGAGIEAHGMRLQTKRR